MLLLQLSRLGRSDLGPKQFRWRGRTEFRQLSAQATLFCTHAIEPRHADQGAEQRTCGDAQRHDDCKGGIQLPEQHIDGHQVSVLNGEKHRCEHQDQYQNRSHRSGLST